MRLSDEVYLLELSSLFIYVKWPPSGALPVLFLHRQSQGKIKQQVKAEYAAAFGADYNTVKTLQLEIDELLDKENLMWQQRSRGCGSSVHELCF